MKGKLPIPNERRKLKGTLSPHREKEKIPESTRLISSGEQPDYFDALNGENLNLLPGH